MVLSFRWRRCVVERGTLTLMTMGSFSMDLTWTETDGGLVFVVGLSACCSFSMVLTWTETDGGLVFVVGLLIGISFSIVFTWTETDGGLAFVVGLLIGVSFSMVLTWTETDEGLASVVDSSTFCSSFSIDLNIYKPRFGFNIGSSDCCSFWCTNLWRFKKSIEKKLLSQ